MRHKLFLSSIITAFFLLVFSAYCFGSDVNKELDIFYTDEKDTLRSVDVFWSNDSKDTNVIVFVHGGGWLSGDKKQYREMAMSLASRGMTVVLVNYRLSPKVKFPVHLEDVCVALAWTINSVSNYNGDPNKIFLMGHSAGGYLITMAVCDDEYINLYDITPRDIAGIITISGVFEIKTQEGGATKKYLGMVFGNDEEIWKEATCQNYINESRNDIPPILISWTDEENDLIKNESLNLIEALNTAGLQYQTFVFKGNDHNAYMTKLQDPESNFSKELTKFIEQSNQR